MAKNPGVETITVIRAAKVDRLSTSSGEPSEHDVEGCAVIPRSSHEEGKGWVIVEGRMVVAPYRSDIEADDQVRVPDGEVFDVDGVPGHYSKGGKGKATIVYLKRRGS